MRNNLLASALGVSICALLPVEPAAAQIPTPPPPPAPPIAEAQEAITAIRKARQCVIEPEQNGFAGRAAALRAAKNLNAVPGTPAWMAARKVVISYIRGRQEGLHCFAGLVAYRDRMQGSAVDRRAVDFQIEALRLGWLAERKHQSIVVSYLLDQDLGAAEENLPYIRD